MEEINVSGRSFSFNYAIGKHSPGGPGFRQPQDIAFGLDNTVFVVNRGSEGEPCGRVSKLTMDSDYIGQFGSIGESDGQFVWPTSVIVDGNGLVYVADEWLHRISIYDGNGDFEGKAIGQSNFMSKWGSYGNKPGELGGPAGMVFDKDENIYITENLNNRVSKFTKYGDHILSWGNLGVGTGEFDGPWGIALDSSGDVYVADWKNDRVQKFTANGEYITSFGKSGNASGCIHLPSDVATDADGDIYIADWWNDKVEVYDKDGDHLISLRGNAETLSKWAVEFLEVNEEDKVAREGMPTLESEYTFGRPISIEIDPRGGIWVVEDNRWRIQIYKKTMDVALAAK